MVTYICNRSWLFLFSILFLGACSSTAPTTSSNSDENPAIPSESKKTVAARTKEPEALKSGIRIESVEFYRDEIRKLAPVADLAEKNAFTLRFDLIESQSRMFVVRAKHVNPDGSPSPLQPIEYMKGVPEDQLQPQRNNAVGQPLYYSYAYRFPNDAFSFTVSGAYVLELVDFESGDTIHTLPFFLSEGMPGSKMTFEEFLGNESNRAVMIQPFVTIPRQSLSKFPCQDVSVLFVQDRNWKTAKSKGICDQSGSAEIQFHLPREQAFYGNFEYRFLDLSTYRTPNARILEINESTDPPGIRLTADNPEFAGPTPPDYFPLEGVQRIGADARYTETEFRLQTGNLLQPTDEIYLVGAFNRWTPDAKSRMTFDATSNEFKNKRLLKEGRYQFSYMLRDASNGTMRFVSTPFTSKNHEYDALIFLKDFQRPIYRLMGSANGRY